MINKFEMALKFLKCTDKELKEVLVEFAINDPWFKKHYKSITNKIKNKGLNAITQEELNRLCDEFVFAIPFLVENMKKKSSN